MNYLCTDGVGWYVKNSNIIIVHSVKELSNSIKGACQNLESKWKNWAKLSAIAILNCLLSFPSLWKNVTGDYIEKCLKIKEVM